MSKILTDILEKYGARSAGEKKFIDIQPVRDIPDQNGNDEDVFSASNINKDHTRTMDRQTVDPAAQDVNFVPMNKVYPEFGADPDAAFDSDEMPTELGESLPANATAHDYIKDFQKSKAPQFTGKSQEKRRQMAVAAFLAHKDSLKEDVLDESNGSFVDHYNDFKKAHEHALGKGMAVTSVEPTKDHIIMKYRHPESGEQHSIGWHHAIGSEQPEINWNSARSELDEDLVMIDHDDGTQTQISKQVATQIADLYANLSEEKVNQLYQWINSSAEGFEKAMQFIDYLHEEHIGWDKLVSKLRKQGKSKEAAEKIAGAIKKRKYG